MLVLDRYILYWVFIPIFFVVFLMGTLTRNISQVIQRLFDSSQEFDPVAHRDKLVIPFFLFFSLGLSLFLFCCFPIQLTHL